MVRQSIHCLHHQHRHWEPRVGIAADNKMLQNEPNVQIPVMIKGPKWSWNSGNNKLTRATRIHVSQTNINREQNEPVSVFLYNWKPWLSQAHLWFLMDEALLRGFVAVAHGFRGIATVKWAKFWDQTSHPICTQMSFCGLLFFNERR